jgi:hypothetical protein
VRIRPSREPGVSLLRRVEVKTCTSADLILGVTEAIRDTGPEIERAQYFAYDLECLVEPEPHVVHYDVLGRP